MMQKKCSLKHLLSPVLPGAKSGFRTVSLPQFHWHVSLFLITNTPLCAKATQVCHR